MEWFAYSHDHDLNGWIIRDILENKHLRLIGQETTSKGVFIGPLFYYLLIPFYLLFKMDPIGGLLLPLIISVFAIFSFYFVFSKIFNEKVGTLASLIYSISSLVVFTDREVVPTQPVMLWSVWFLYGLWLLLKGKQKAFVFLGVLIGLTWNFNLALIILFPLVIVVHIYSKKALDFKHLAIGLLALVFTLSPFLVFETRHNFSQSRAIYASLTSSKDYVEGAGSGYAKFDRVMQLVFRNTTRLVWGADHKIPEKITFLLLIFLFMFSFAKKLISKNLFIIMFFWLGIFILFFSLNPINISEYYLNGMNVIWIGILSVFISWFFSAYKYLGLIAAGTLIAINFYSFSIHPIVNNGYVERKTLVNFIKKDAEAHNFPCISVSYITAPGNNFGYRYFFWLANLHVNNPDSGSPVYTIAFPHSMVGRIDKSFGALGLVLPGYERYTVQEVNESCSGGDSNVTDPLIKFTK